jgi:hypothetical protein
MGVAYTPFLSAMHTLLLAMNRCVNEMFKALPLVTTTAPKLELWFPNDDACLISAPAIRKWLKRSAPHTKRIMRSGPLSYSQAKKIAPDTHYSGGVRMSARIRTRWSSTFCRTAIASLITVYEALFASQCMAVIPAGRPSA